MNCAFTRQQVKWSEFQIVERVHRPAVLAVLANVMIQSIQALDGLFLQCIKSWNALGCPCQQRLLNSKRLDACIADRCILLTQQLLRFR